MARFLWSLVDLNGTASRKRGWIIFGLAVVAFGAGFDRVANADTHSGRAYFWKSYWIPAESMKPTLLVGDFIIATSVNAATVQRGDVIIFRHPVNGTDYIKRLIGLPGDTVQVRDGLLYINGTLAPQVPDGVFEEVNEPQGPMGNRPRCQEVTGDGTICAKSRSIETLPGGSQHPVLNIDTNGPADNTDIFTVPEGQYFFMRDNRDNSLDSRFSVAVGGLGFVPAGNIHHRAWFILFSGAGSSLMDVTAWRSDRYFKVIR